MPAARDLETALGSLPYLWRPKEKKKVRKLVESKFRRVQRPTAFGRFLNGQPSPVHICRRHAQSEVCNSGLRAQQFTE